MPELKVPKELEGVLDDPIEYAAVLSGVKGRKVEPKR
jgi:hypothetical protein